MGISKFSYQVDIKKWPTIEVDKSNVNRLIQLLKSSMKMLQERIGEACEDKESYLIAWNRIKAFLVLMNGDECFKEYDGILSFVMLMFRSSNNFYIDSSKEARNIMLNDTVNAETMIDVFKERTFTVDMIESFKIALLKPSYGYSSMGAFKFNDGKNINAYEWLKKVNKILRGEFDIKDQIDYYEFLRKYNIDNAELQNTIKEYKCPLLDAQIYGQEFNFKDMSGKEIGINIWLKYILQKGSFEDRRKSLKYDLLVSDDKIKNTINDLYADDKRDLDKAFKDVIEMTLISVPVLSRYGAYKWGKDDLMRNRENIIVDNYEANEAISFSQNINYVCELLKESCNYKKERTGYYIDCPLYMGPIFKPLSYPIKEERQFIDIYTRINNQESKGYIYSLYVIQDYIDYINKYARDDVDDYIKMKAYNKDSKALTRIEQWYLQEEIYRKLGHELSLVLLVEMNKRLKIPRRFFEVGTHQEVHKKLVELCKQLSIYQNIFSQDTTWIVRNFFILFDVAWKDKLKEDFKDDLRKKINKFNLQVTDELIEELLFEYGNVTSGQLKYKNKDKSSGNRNKVKELIRVAYFSYMVDYFTKMLKSFRADIYIDNINECYSEIIDHIDLADIYKLIDCVKDQDMVKYINSFRGETENYMESEDKINLTYQIIQKEMMKNLLGVKVVTGKQV